MDSHELRGLFEHHPPTNSYTIHAHEEARNRFKALATWVNDNFPDSREKSQVIDNLDDGCQHLNALIARRQVELIPRAGIGG